MKMNNKNKTNWNDMNKMNKNKHKTEKGVGGRAVTEG